MGIYGLPLEPSNSGDVVVWIHMQNSGAKPGYGMIPVEMQLVMDIFWLV